jgi:hypothetical protein
MYGDLTVDDTELTKYVDAAAEEMDATIGFDYVLPIVTNSIPSHVVLTLKRCNVLIATGRFILSQAVASEDGSTHAYGASLLKEGQAILGAIRTGQLDLTGVPRISGNVQGNAPSIINTDVTSALDAFYGNTGRAGTNTRRYDDGYPLEFWGPG